MWDQREAEVEVVEEEAKEKRVEEVEKEAEEEEVDERFWLVVLTMFRAVGRLLVYTILPPLPSVRPHA